MASEYFCFNLIHIHTGILILSAIMLILNFYVIGMETYNYIDFQNEIPITANMTIHEYMSLSVQDAGRYYADFVLYGEGTLRFLVEYLCRVVGTVCCVCLLLGNRLNRPKLYLPFIYFSAIGVLFTSFEIIQDLVEAIRVKTHHYSWFIPERPVEVRGNVFNVLLEYALANLISLAILFYLLYLAIQGKKYLHTQQKHQVHPIEIINTHENEPNIFGAENDQRV